MDDKKQTEQLNDAELDQITGGAGEKSLLGHELTHAQGRGDKKYVGETEKNFSFGVEREAKDSSKIVSGGGGNDI